MRIRMFTKNFIEEKGDGDIYDISQINPPFIVIASVYGYYFLGITDDTPPDLDILDDETEKQIRDFIYGDRVHCFERNAYADYLMEIYEKSLTEKSEYRRVLDVNIKE